jgi:hypothetical protein
VKPKVDLPPLYRVQLERHRVDRWIIPAHTAIVPAPDERFACEQVIRWAHADAGAPPWKPFIRRSLKHATAERASVRQRKVSLAA